MGMGVESHAYDYGEIVGLDGWQSEQLGEGLQEYEDHDTPAGMDVEQAVNHLLTIWEDEVTRPFSMEDLDRYMRGLNSRFSEEIEAEWDSSSETWDILDIREGPVRKAVVKFSNEYPHNFGWEMRFYSDDRQENYRLRGTGVGLDEPEEIESSLEFMGFI